MMKRNLKLTALILAIVACLSVTAMAAPYVPEHETCARFLQEAELFRGTAMEADGSVRLDLDKQATRMQGLIMLIRLLGEEEAALAYTGACPFTDLSGNAARYAAYAYSKGYTTGKTADTFGNTPLQANAFLTFTLRALGYDDRKGDFKYSTAHLKAAEVGLIQEGEYADAAQLFMRDDCAYVSFRALGATLKEKDTYLIEMLENTKAVPEGMFMEYWIVRNMIMPEEAPEQEKMVLRDDTRQVVQDFIAAMERRDEYPYAYVLEWGPENCMDFSEKRVWENVEILRNDPTSSETVAGYCRDYENGMLGKIELADCLAAWLSWNGDAVETWIIPDNPDIWGEE